MIGLLCLKYPLMTSAMKLRVKTFIFILAVLFSALILLSVNVDDIFNDTGVSTTKIPAWVQLLTHLIFLVLLFFIVFYKNSLNYYFLIVFIISITLLLFSTHTITVRPLLCLGGRAERPARRHT